MPRSPQLGKFTASIRGLPAGLPPTRCVNFKARRYNEDWRCRKRRGHSVGVADGNLHPHEQLLQRGLLPNVARPSWPCAWAELALSGAKGCPCYVIRPRRADSAHRALQYGGQDISPRHKSLKLRLPKAVLAIKANPLTLIDSHP